MKATCLAARVALVLGVVLSAVPGAAAQQCGPAWSDAWACGEVPGSLGVNAQAVFNDGMGPALVIAGQFNTAGGIPCNNIAKWNGRQWTPLGAGLTGGVSPLVTTLRVFNDGSGDALYAGGNFTTAGGNPAAGVAKWNGLNWSPLGPGITGGAGQVLTLFPFDFGTGTQLYAGGTFTTAGGNPATNIARWNGSSWSPAGTALTGSVRALAMYNDGTGDALYAGGSFPGHIQAYRGTVWLSPNAGGIPGSNSNVSALLVHNDGSGSSLFVAGGFTSAGGVPVNNITKYSGAGWAPLGSGLVVSSSFPGVAALAVFTDGSGPALYAAGNLTAAGGNPVGHIAKWNGTTWFALGAGTNGAPSTLIEFDDLGRRLYAGGSFSTAGGVAMLNLATWNGSAWVPPGSGISGGFAPQVLTLAAGPAPDVPGSPDMLAIGGVFNAMGGLGQVAGSAVVIQRCPSCTNNLRQIGLGLYGISAATAEWFRSLAPFRLFVGGAFTQPCNNIFDWDGTQTQCPITGIGPQVQVLRSADLGTGPRLYIGGTFITAPSGPDFMARYDGVSTLPVPGSPNGPVFALRPYTDPPTGQRLLAVGGLFPQAGGLSVNNVAAYQVNPEAWRQLGVGMDNSIRDEFEWDRGHRAPGPVLVAAGDFTHAGGLPANYIAQWDGVQWSPLGSGLNGPARALAVWDDRTGGGPVLYVGGLFTMAGGIPANHIARWDGTQWSALGPGASNGTNDEVDALAVWDMGDGTGPTLMAGGKFTTAGGLSSGRIAQFMGSGTPAITKQPANRTVPAGQPAGFNVAAIGRQPLGYRWRKTGVNLNNGGPISGADTAALTINPAQPGDAGSYDAVVTNSCGSVTSSPAMLNVTAACYPNCDASTTPPILNVLDFACFLNAFAAGLPYANCDGSTTPPIFNVIDFGCFLNWFAAGCP